MISSFSKPLDILILSNGPGELSTWVKPVVKQLRQRLGKDPDQVRISVVLSPCPNASGQEGTIARSYPEVDRVQDAEHFFPFLILGKTAESWDWRSAGIIIFLGGDPLFPVLLSKRLKYKTLVYAEWETLWTGAIDRFAVMSPKLVEKAKPSHRHKFTVVGDLMSSEAIENSEDFSQATRTIGLLPGSKAAKLAQGVPIMSAIADLLKSRYPDLQFVIPMAPTLTEETLAEFGDRTVNPIVDQVGGVTAKLERSTDRQTDGQQVWLQTSGGTSIEVKTIGDDGPRTPHYKILKRCQICVTTVGANTAELGSLAVPMVMILPTNQLDAMRAWNGIPGILANLPGLGSLFAKIINQLALRKLGLIAWPNIWAGKMIVPEMVGYLTPEMVVDRVSHYLDHPDELLAMQKALREIRGESGAATKLVAIVEELIKKEEV